jgi:hypothetical protein
MAHGDRSVDVFVRKLRQKLEKVSPSWRYIHTHFGIGYRFAAEPAGAEEDKPGVDGAVAGAVAGLPSAAERDGAVRAAGAGAASEAAERERALPVPARA